MAIYHATMKSFSRGKGDSSVAAAAYRAGFDLVDTNTGLGHDYTRRHGVAFFQMLAPKGAPAWCLDAKKFWVANEAAETRLNARVCREVEVSLPHSLDDAQRKVLALALGQLLVDRYDVAVLVAVHTPSRLGDQRNHHVHLLMSARKVGVGGLGARACAVFDARQGGGTRELRQIRKDIAQVINRHLAKAGAAARVDHRSLRDQARDAALRGDFDRARELTRAPTRHLGKAKVAIMRKAKFTAEVKGVGGREAALALSKIVMDHMKQSGSIVQEVPNAHSHAAALKDRVREAAGSGESAAFATKHRVSPVQEAKERLARQPAPRSGLYTPYTGKTLQLSRVTRLALSTGKDAEVLNAEAQLIEDWLEAQREVAQQSLEVLRVIPGIQVEPAFQQAYASLLCRRTDSYAKKPFLFEDTEVLAKAVSRYVHAMVRPHRARMRVLKAQAEIADHDPSSDTQIAHRARRRLARAKVHVSPRIVAIQNWRINKARQDMAEARQALEKSFTMDWAETPLAMAASDDVEASIEQGGGWQLKPRRPRMSP
ncbi:MobA/MobL family protein [Xanthomonas prunicola]|uniref:MobA/MobL family protein n=1 Tax=Xanthomonas prunicola TaxID=2053930 RepID=UPI0021B235BE|nr:MobA/MobL family protein [Xanthomonas prunicola]UXA69441.1 MobA/MobL family protein [Xanthomonas prunicola]